MPRPRLSAGSRYRPSVVVTLCVLLTAIPGRERELAHYEDQVLALLADHDGSVVVRFAATDGPLTEVQVLEFASERDLKQFQSDPRRLALSGLHDGSIASTIVIRGTLDRLC
jgi:hypothetical protein